MLALRLLCLQLACLTIDLAIADKNYNISIYPPTTTAPQTKQIPTIPIIQPIPTIPPFPVLPQGYLYYSDIGTAYKVYFNEIDWHSARQACNADGARLAVIDTWQKIRYVQSLSWELVWVWTGISRESRRYNWATVDGGLLARDLLWGPASPKIYGNCIALRCDRFLTGLSNWECGVQKAYVCEIIPRVQNDYNPNINYV